MSLYYKADNSYLFVNGRKIFRFKAGNKNVNFSAQYCLSSISNGVRATKSREVSLNGNVHDFFWLYYNSINKSDRSNIQKYLMTNNNAKQCLGLLNKKLLCY